MRHWIVIVVLVLGCTTLSAPSDLNRERLTIVLEAVPTDHRPEVRIRISNSGKSPVSFGPAFGFENAFIGVRLRDRNGKPVDGPNVELFADRMKRICLKPGQSWSMDLDLNRWAAEWNGKNASKGDEPAEEWLSYHLSSGTYSAQAFYREIENGKEMCKSALPVGAEVASTWVTVEVDTSTINDRT